MFDFKDLNYEELQTYENLRATYESKQFEVSDIRKIITHLKNEVAYELCRTDISETNKIIKLQARLENMIMIENTLIQPELAKEQYDKQIAKLSNNLEKGKTL